MAQTKRLISDPLLNVTGYEQTESMQSNFSVTLSDMTLYFIEEIQIMSRILFFSNILHAYPTQCHHRVPSFTIDCMPGAENRVHLLPLVPCTLDNTVCNGGVFGGN